MAEIIGVAASATQLGVACFSLIDIIRKIKGGASTLKRYHKQLQDLQSISTCISENPLLQTPEIGIQTEALLSTINNNCINPLLRKGRLLRIWGLLYREQDLLETFVTLDRQKSTLSLAIEHIQSKALYQIQNDIQVMAGQDSQNAPADGAGSMDKPGAVVCKKSPTYTSPSAVQSPEELQLFNLYIRSLVPPELQMNPSPSQSSSNRQGPTEPPKTRPSPSSDHTNERKSGDTTGPQWINPVAGHGIQQDNGYQYYVTGQLSQQITKNEPQRKNDNPIRIINPISIGDGDQNNRHLFEFSGDVTGATIPNMSGDLWHSPRSVPWPYKDSRTEASGTTQVNGVVVQYRETSSEKAKDK
jgi:hypothetical protein